MSSLIDKYISLASHLIPKKITRPSVGLDIGTSSCKAVELIPTVNSFEISNWIVEPIAHGDVSGCVKRILARLDTSSRKFFTAVYGQGTLIRYVDMPRMSLEDLRKSIDLESDKHLPFPKEKIYTDCSLLGENTKDARMSVLIAAAKKEIIDQRLRLLVEAGLSVDKIAMNAVALVNAFGLLKLSQQSEKSFSSDTNKSNIVAILDMGDTVSSLIILKDQLPRFTREIFIGGKELSRRISNALNVSLDEAEKIKCQSHGSSSPDILTACDSILANLAAEIRLSFDYLAAESNFQVAKLFLTGGSSQLEGVTEFFSKSIDVATERWDLISSLKLSANVSRVEIEKDAGKLAVAVGLAVSQ